MVFTYKKDPSNDLSYSSIAADKKAWQQKGTHISKSDRFRTFGFVESYGFPSERMLKNRADVVSYEGMVGMGTKDAITKFPRRFASAFISKQRKFTDLQCVVAGDTRSTVSTTPPFPHGPGTYDVSIPQDNPAGSYKDPYRPTSSFVSRDRPDPWRPVEASPDVSDVLKRDQKNWQLKGFKIPREGRLGPIRWQR